MGVSLSPTLAAELARQYDIVRELGRGDLTRISSALAEAEDLARVQPPPAGR